MPLFWLHQLEEWSLPVIGIDYSNPPSDLRENGFSPVVRNVRFRWPSYPVVNIAATMSLGHHSRPYLFRRIGVIGLSFWGLLFANGVTVLA